MFAPWFLSTIKLLKPYVRMHLPVVYLQHCHQLPFAGDRDVEWKTHAPGGAWEVTVIRGVPVRWIVIEVMFHERNIAIKHVSQCRAYIIQVDRRHKPSVQITPWILKLHLFFRICSLIILQTIVGEKPELQVYQEKLKQNLSEMF